MVFDAGAMKICIEIQDQFIAIVSHKKPGATCVTPGNLNTQ
jgi:hypothetical protein